MGNPKLASEIVEAASNIPIEFQEHILDVIKAMTFTRKIVEKRHSVENGEHGEKESSDVTEAVYK